MNELPPFVKSLAFWKAFSFAVAGVLAALAALERIPPEWALSAGAILAAVLTVLEWFGITPEVRARQALEEALKALKEVRALRAQLTETTLPRKTVRK